MDRLVYRYLFPEEIDLDEVESLLVAALLSTEALHGESRTRLEAGHFLDKDQRTLAVDATSQVGRDLNKLLVGQLNRAFGPDEFTVRRVEKSAMDKEAR